MPWESRLRGGRRLCLDRMGLSYGAMGGLLWVITVTGTSGLRHVLGINRTKSDRIGLLGTGGF